MFITDKNGPSNLPLRRRMLYGLEAALERTGLADRYVRTFNISGAIILMYHSVPNSSDSFWISPSNQIEPNLFEQQMQWLSENRNVISIDELLDALTQGMPLPAGTVVLTFDDGYRDFLTVAAPILEKYDLPAIVYLPTGYINRGENHWSDRLFASFRTRTRDLLSAGGRYFDLFVDGTVHQAYDFLGRQLLEADPLTRDSVLESVEHQLRPGSAIPRLLLNWDEVRELLERYPQVSIGIHTVNHVDLTAGSEELVRRELLQSVADIEREAATRPVHFSFPYNRYSASACAILRELHCKSAVCSGTDCLISAGNDPFMLPRVSVPDSMSLFRFWTSGAYPRLPKAILGRA